MQCSSRYFREQTGGANRGSKQGTQTGRKQGTDHVSKQAFPNRGQTTFLPNKQGAQALVKRAESSFANAPQWDGIAARGSVPARLTQQRAAAPFSQPPISAKPRPTARPGPARLLDIATRAQGKRMASYQYIYVMKGYS